MKKTYYKHPHPLMLFIYFRRLIILLIIPLLRESVNIVLGSGEGFIHGLWFDGLILLLIIILSLVSYSCNRYTFDGNTLVIRHGVLFKSKTSIPIASVSTVSLEIPWYYRPFGAVALYMETDAGRARSNDAKLIVSRFEALRIINSNSGVTHDFGFLKRTYQPRFVALAIVSAVLSNSFVGVVIAVSLLSRAGGVFGEGIKNQIIGTVTEFAKIAAFGVPPLFSLFTILIIAGWAIAFVNNILKVMKFRVQRNRDSLFISSGFFVRRDFNCQIKFIDCIDIRQTIFTHIIGMYYSFVRCVGYGKQNGEATVLLPAIKKNSILSQLRILLPEYKYSEEKFRPEKGSLYRYCMWPIWCLLLLYPAITVVDYLFPVWSEIISLAAAALIIPLGWWLFMCIFDRRTAGISFSQGFMTVKCGKKLTLHTYVIPRHRIEKIRLRASVFQKRNDSTDILVFLHNEKRSVIKLKNIRLSDADTLIKDFSK